MAITLQVNPYTDINGDRQQRGKVYRSAMQLRPEANYPTRIRETRDPGDPRGQSPGFVNLVEVTATGPDSLKKTPFLLCLKGHKVFILRRRFTDEQTLRIWFIAKRIDQTLVSVETEDVEVLNTGKLVLTIETEEETADFAELDVIIEDTAP